MEETSGKISAVLVGCGGMANAWLNAADELPDLDITALVDVDIDKAVQLREKYALSSAKTASSLGEILTSVKPDAVFDCTVPEAHADVTLEALNNGCHVLGEKPMADSLDKAQKMMQTAQANNRIYAVIKNRRYTNPIIKYRDTVTSSPIGDITTVNADFFMGPRFGGFRAVMDHVLLRDMAIHSFDQARFISGKDPVSVYCHEWNPKGSWFKHGASAVAIFEMTDDVVFTYRGSWCAQGLPTAWECEWRTIGTDGTATWDGKDDIRCQSVTRTEDGEISLQDHAPAEPSPLSHTGHAGLIREFTDCVKHGGTPQTDCTNNIKSFAMVEAAVKSAETGEKVPVEIPATTTA